jgi:hypothetical protein
MAYTSILASAYPTGVKANGSAIRQDLNYVLDNRMTMKMVNDDDC